MTAPTTDGSFTRMALLPQDGISYSLHWVVGLYMIGPAARAPILHVALYDITNLG